MNSNRFYKIGFWTASVLVAGYVWAFPSRHGMNDTLANSFKDLAYAQYGECVEILKRKEAEEKKDAQTKREERVDRQLRSFNEQERPTAEQIVAEHRQFYERYPETLDPGYFTITRDIRDSDALVPSRRIMTQKFFRHLEHLVKDHNYEAAVDLFLPVDERSYGTTLGGSFKPDEILVTRLGLSAFLPTEVCGTPETPSCEAVAINPSCGCPIPHPEYAQLILPYITGIRVQEKTNSAEGKIEVQFDQDMRYGTISGSQIFLHELRKGESYRTQFTPHWEFDSLEEGKF